ncbi:MAG: general secretion pathway protein GspM [Alphaproteobacteria bacterium]|nr:general secretion pathway protein GspM [Alphaproteobacteria bacterium]MBV9687432.1 general secretion pathway protein GspM [Alphaproteobacteria bacterium]
MPNGRRGQLLALGLLLLALAGVYLLVVSPLQSLYAERAAVLENRRMLLPRMQAAADELPILRARAEQLRVAAGTRKITLEGASDPIAAATLQSRIEELAASVGATIGSTESLPAEARSGYRRIGLRYVLSGSYETLVKFLAKLEAANPPLVIDNLHIHGVLRRPGTPASAGLDAGLDVYAYRDGEKSTAAKQ